MGCIYPKQDSNLSIGRPKFRYRKFSYEYPIDPGSFDHWPLVSGVDQNGLRGNNLLHILFQQR